MEKEIFISHSSTDEKEAKKICDYFERNYISCFIAPRDIKVGASYAEELLDGIDNSKILLLMLSNESNNSPHVLREVERAVSHSIPIVVYRLEFVELSKSMEYFLMTNQWREIKKSDDLSELYSLVKSILREKEEEEFDELEKNLKMEMLKGEAELNKVVIIPDSIDKERSNEIKEIYTQSEDESKNVKEVIPLVSAEDILARTEEALADNIYKEMDKQEHSIELFEEIEDDEFEEENDTTNEVRNIQKKENFLKIFAVASVVVIVVLVAVIVSIASGKDDNSSASGKEESSQNILAGKEENSSDSQDEEKDNSEENSNKEESSEEASSEEETSKYIHDSEAGREQRESMTIAIDAALQKNDNREKEAVGPGATETKNKMGMSSTGVSTGVSESELNLQIALKLEKELEKRGYNVLMTRKSNDVNISNAKRAEMANDANVAALIRIDTNVSDNSNVNGAMTICQTENNPYNAEVHYQSRVLSQFVLEEIVKMTGCEQQHIWETDTMTFINWSKVPVTIVEVGYLSNPEEDKLLVTEDYQEKLVIGIANGIDKAVLTS